ncbi:MAG: LD-carboxypeptidase [bacterium]|nr:LD-carboxypeptidase [bacterium]
MTTRRELLIGGAAAGLLAAARPAEARPAAAEERRILKPPRLRPGDRVGMINPARAAFRSEPVEVQAESLEAVGLVPVKGANFHKRRGYFAGTDEERADDVNAFFADPAINALFGTGGWGSARVLPHLDFDLIRAHPKVVAGFSDVTALLNGIHAQTGLVTFHGPHPRAKWSADYFRRVLFDGELVEFSNPREIPEHQLVQTRDRWATITPGKAHGRLFGGNLTVLAAIVGTPYMPDLTGGILFLEDINEEVYRVDRMLTQMHLAGLLDGLHGFVFGSCRDCEPDSTYGSLTLEEVLADHVAPLGIPAYRGAMIGHIPRQFTLPIGIEAEIDADAGSLRLLEPAVS